jgi:APA family basic amino acid/polyamine antiporter
VRITSTKSIATIGVYTATAIVIANMIGTGVFGSLGFQVISIKSVFAIIMLWLTGGVLSFCGALSYAELGAALPRSGGEYNFLSHIYHPMLGFISGWVSLVAGFAAPIAVASMLFGKYFSNVNPVLINEDKAAVAIIILISIIHTINTAVGSGFQRVMTFLKVAIIVFFVIAGFLYIPSFTISVLPQTGDVNYIFSGSFAVSLIYVSYAYSGWNASSYIAGEMKDPGKNIPKSILYGTVIVTLLYVLLNFIFLYTVPMDQLAGKQDVGHEAAKAIFGAAGGRIMSGVIAFLLISTISSMIFAGPRVLQVMGEDTTMLKFLSVKSISHIPYVALWFQSLIAITLVVTGSFETILSYVGFTLQLITFLTVMGVIVLRYTEPNLIRPFKTWGYPVVPVLFLALTAWILYSVFVAKPMVGLIGIGTIAIGALIYYLDKKFFKEQIIK